MRGLGAAGDWEAFCARCGYVGLTYTQRHSEMLIGRLKDLMKSAMRDSNTKLYNAEYARAVGALDAVNV